MLQLQNRLPFSAVYPPCLAHPGNEVTKGVFTAAETIPPAKQRSAPAVKKLILIATGFVFLAGGSYFLNATHGQSSEDVPHRVGLIDVGYVFSKYDKLKFLQAEMNAEVQKERDNLNAKVKKIKQLQEEIKEFNDGTPEYTTRDARLTKLISEIET